MVAHLGVLATSLSHNFSRCGKGCTNGGETDYERRRSHSRNVLRSLVQRADGCQASVFETRHSLRVATRLFSFFWCRSGGTISRPCEHHKTALGWRWIPDAASCKINTCRQGEISTGKT